MASPAVDFWEGLFIGISGHHSVAGVHLLVGVAKPPVRSSTISFAVPIGRPKIFWKFSQHWHGGGEGRHGKAREACTNEPSHGREVNAGWPHPLGAWIVRVKQPLMKTPRSPE